jgi:hypothetical protein
MTLKTEMIEIEKKDVKNITNVNIFKTSLGILKEKVSLIDIRGSTIHLIIKYVIEELDGSPLKGAEKKEMGLKLIKELVIDLAEGEDEKILLNMINDGTVGNLIDLIIDATKGKINVNAIATVGISCMTSCLPYCFPSLKKKIK